MMKPRMKPEQRMLLSCTALLLLGPVAHLCC